MIPPRIDRGNIPTAIDAARQLLQLYQREREKLVVAIEQLEHEVKGAEALVRIVERGKSRREHLKDCASHADRYADFIGGEDMAREHGMFLGMVQCELKRRIERLASTDQAIALLKEDISDLEVISNCHFRSPWAYFAFSSPGWSFQRFRLENPDFLRKCTFMPIEQSLKPALGNLTSSF